MTFNALIKKFEKGLWAYHILIPKEILMELKNKKIKRILCQINNYDPFHAGLMPVGNGEYFIKLNQEKIKAYTLALDQKVQIKITEDPSKYGMEMPEIMQVFLSQDTSFNSLFHRLTAGKQRSLIYIVLKVKSEQKQIEKTTVIANHLKKNNGNVDFKVLQEDFKSFIF